jgi:hypothetical protein
MPSIFLPVVMILLVGGALGWLVAAVLGFSRARAFGTSIRWFALSAACLLIYHLQWIVFTLFGISSTNQEQVLSVGAFFNLFVLLGAICSIIGFTRLTDPRQ